MCRVCNGAMQSVPPEKSPGGDLVRLLSDLQDNVPVSLIVEPSLRTVFPGWPGVLAWFRSRGVRLVYDASLGGDICVWAWLRYLERDQPPAVVAGLCPPVVSYCLSCRPELSAFLSPVLTPAEATAVYMRRYRGVTGKIALLSPCYFPAPDAEMPHGPDYRISFNALLRFLEERNIALPESTRGFDHLEVGVGSTLSIPGGLAENLEFFMGPDIRVDSVTGLRAFELLAAFADADPALRPRVLDVMTCEEGCDGGPGSSPDPSPLVVRARRHAWRKARMAWRSRSVAGRALAAFDRMLALDDFLLRREVSPVQPGVPAVFGPAGVAAHPLPPEGGPSDTAPAEPPAAPDRALAPEPGSGTVGGPLAGEAACGGDGADPEPAAPDDRDDGRDTASESVSPEDTQGADPEPVGSDETRGAAPARTAPEDGGPSGRDAGTAGASGIPGTQGDRDMKDRTDALDVVRDVADALLAFHGNDYAEAVPDALARIAGLVGGDHGSVWMCDACQDPAAVCERRFSWSALPDLPEASFEGPLPGRWLATLARGEVLDLTRGDLDPTEAGALPALFQSLLLVPVHLRGRFQGFLAVLGCSAREPGSEGLSAVRACATVVISSIMERAMAARLLEAKEEAQAGTRAKSAFLAIMSHEMRTPLNAIIGLSELMLGNGDVSGRQAENLEKIYSSGVTLLGIINDILDVSKIESGKFDVVSEEYDVPSLVNDTLSLNVMRLGSKPITFNIEVDENLPARLVGDELRVKQIFSNLLSNAFKYTDQGSVTLKIFSEREGDTVWLCGEIADTGVGIRPEDMKNLFLEYTQLNAGSSRAIEGTGLGLSITRKLVEIMGGEITVSSEYGRGSTFAFRVRQVFATDKRIGPEIVDSLRSFAYAVRKRDRSAKLIRIQLPYARVLVVDDVQTNLDVARGMLKPYGMEIDCVTSGQAAVDLIREETIRYDAIFMDHMMPGMDGIEAVRIIRNDINTDYARTIPIIALTANAIAGSEDLFLQNGFQAFLAKPIDINRMDAAINRWIRNRDKEIECGLHIPDPQEEGGAVPSDAAGDRIRPFLLTFSIVGMDLRAGLERFGGDSATYLEVLRSFAANTPPLLEKLATEPVMEALDAYATIVHGIKGSSLGICAHDVGEKARVLEMAARSGDAAYVQNSTGNFAADANDLIFALNQIIGKIDSGIQKPFRNAPDPRTLEALVAACRTWDMDGVDTAMEQLEACTYGNDNDLVVWLREQADVMGFGAIIERLGG